MTRRRPTVRVRRIASIVIAFTLAWTTASVAVAGPSHAQVDIGTGGLSLLQQTVETVDDFVLDLQLPGVVEDDDVVVLTVHRAVQDRAGFRRTLAGQSLGDALIRRVTAVSELNPTIRGNVTLTIDADTVAITIPEPGVYPVSVELRTASQATVGQLVTHLVRVTDPTPTPVRVAVSLIMDVGPQRSPTGQIAAGDTTASWMDTIIDRPDLPVTVQPTPFLFDQFRTDTRMRRFVDRLATSEVVAAPYVPIDLRSLELAGLSDRADALFARGVETTAREIDREPITTRWLSRTEPEPDAIRLWHARGVRDIVVGMDRADLDAPVEIRTDDGALRALVAPSWFAETHPQDAVLAAHQVIAELAVVALTNPEPTSAVLMFGTDTPFDQEYVDQLLDSMVSASVIETVTLSEAVSIPQAVDDDGRPRELVVDGETSGELDGDVALYLDAVAKLSSYGSMISPDDAHLVHDVVSERLLLSLGRGISGIERNAVAREAIATINIEINAVEPPPLGGVSLTSREATAPFSFRNGADYPMRIEVRFLSDKARFVDFDDGETTTIVLEPGVTTREFRVQALSAGSFPLRIEVFSPDGELELGAVDITMRSTVPSGVGVALTVGAIVVLVAWWGRDLIRGRRRVAA